MYSVREFRVPEIGKTVLAIDVNPSSSKPDIGPIHYVHIIDRSGSMYYSINQLVDNVQETFKLIRADDFVSIIWFSSSGQYRTLVKGAKKSDDLSKKLDDLRSVLGYTCFSDPIQEAATIVDELGSICPTFSITLFTDGCPVTSWGVQEEERRIFGVLDKLGKKVMAFNTVGYGNYYNRDLLVRMSQTSQFGVMTHTRDIGSYLNVFTESSDRVSGLVRQPVCISAPNGQIVYRGTTATKMEGHVMDLDSIEAGQNTFYAVYDSLQVPVVSVNGERVPTKRSFSTTGEGETDFLYAYAYELYYAGKRREALEIVANVLRDKYLADLQTNAFTPDEVGAYLEQLKFAVFTRGHRLAQGTCPEGYVPGADALCVMDVLKALYTGDNYYVPYSKSGAGYARIGRKTEDQHNLFEASNDEVVAPVRDLVFNKEHLNLSLRFSVDGKVKINPKSAERVGLDKVQKARIYRTHTFVKDGFLNVESAEFKLDAVTQRKLRDMGLSLQAAGFDPKKPSTRIARERFVINFRGLPIVNRTYVNQSADIDKVFKDTVTVSELEALQKVVNHYRDRFDERQNLPREARGTDFTPDQIEVLKEHGLDKGLSYHGVDNKVAKAEDSDYYEVRTMTFYLKGVSSIPKIQDVLNKSAKGTSLTVSQQIVADQVKVLQKEAKAFGIDLDGDGDKTGEWLDQQLKAIRSELAFHRTNLNTLKLAKILTGDWFEGLKTDDKGNFLYESKGMTMIARADRTRQYID